MTLYLNVTVPVFDANGIHRYQRKYLSEFDCSHTISTVNEVVVLNFVIETMKMHLWKHFTTKEQYVKLIKDNGMFEVFSYNHLMMNIIREMRSML